MSSTTLYQSAVLQDGNSQKRLPSTLASASTTTTPVLAHSHVKYTSAHPFTPEFVQGHLKNGNNSTSRARALYDERVRRRQIGLAERRGDSKSQAVREKRKAKAGKEDAAARVRRERMGRREAAEKGVWRLQADEARWDAFVPLHRLWLGYMSELLGLGTAPSASESQQQEEGKGPSRSAPGPAPTPALPQPAGTMHAKLIKADFHGSIMTVRRSKNAALVGASGIVVQETENTFNVVTRKNKSKVLPKQGSVFAFAVPLYSTEPAAGGSGASGNGLGTKNGGGDNARRAGTGTVLDGPHIEIELYGNQFCFRAADRAGRKFKHKETIEL